jgi:hypothetical protein
MMLCNQLDGYHVSEDTTSNFCVASSSILKKDGYKSFLWDAGDHLCDYTASGPNRSQFDIFNYENLKSKVN